MSADISRKGKNTESLGEPKKGTPGRIPQNEHEMHLVEVSSQVSCWGRKPLKQCILLAAAAPSSKAMRPQPGRKTAEIRSPIQRYFSRSTPLLLDCAPAPMAALHTSFFPYLLPQSKNLYEYLSPLYSRDLLKYTDEEDLHHIQNSSCNGICKVSFLIFPDCMRGPNRSWTKTVYRFTTLAPILSDIGYPEAVANTYCYFTLILNWKISFFRCFSTLSAESVRSCTSFSVWALWGRPSGPGAGCSHPSWIAALLTGLSRLVTSQDTSLGRWICLILKG